MLLSLLLPRPYIPVIATDENGDLSESASQHHRGIYVDLAWLQDRNLKGEPILLSSSYLSPGLHRSGSEPDDVMFTTGPYL